jgi:hypothetical protein
MMSVTFARSQLWKAGLIYGRSIQEIHKITSPWTVRFFVVDDSLSGRTHCDQPVDGATGIGAVATSVHTSGEVTTP